MFYFDRILDKEILKSDKIGVKHFFTTRELILKSKEPDSEFQFLNREKIKEFYNLEKLITPSQRHTSNIKTVSLSDNDYDMTDSLILDDKRIGIFLNFADCTPLIFYDKKRKIGAIAHAGWRGTVQKIGVKTIFAMNSNPKDIVCLIGPCICYECFETNSDIKNELISTIKNSSDTCKKGKNDKYFVDLKKINKIQLEEIGVIDFDITTYCTCCNNDKFFSYRKENKTTNRMSAFLCLK